MKAVCGAAADKLASFLGYSCEDASPIMTLRNPLGLANWTLPVLEWTVVLGAVFALVHALRRWRREGDPTNFALWVASLVYLFVIEPPLYFPEWFGLQDNPGFIFSHNVFTVQFMFDRLPLYIIAFYPMMSQVSYEIVRAFGVFRSRGALAGAVSVAFVNQAFYEIFDQLGPQQKWWAWDLDNPVNHPLLASVPMNSVWIFAAVSFGVLTYLIFRLVGLPVQEGRVPGGWSLGWRTVLAGALAPVGMILANIPNVLIAGVDHPNVHTQTIVLTVETVALWLIGGFLLYRQWQENRRTAASSGADSPFLRVYPAAYLAVLAILWFGSAGDFSSATAGYTAHGTPVGNAPFVVACYLVAVVTLVAAITVPRSVPKVPAGTGG